MYWEQQVEHEIIVIDEIRDHVGILMSKSEEIHQMRVADEDKSLFQTLQGETVGEQTEEAVHLHGK